MRNSKKLRLTNFETLNKINIINLVHFESNSVKYNPLIKSKETQLQAPKTAAYYISPIEIGVFLLEIKCLKSATRLLNRVCVRRQGLDLSKEVLRISVCHFISS